MKRAVFVPVVAVVAVVAAAAWWLVLPSPEERSARDDVRALGEAVADYVVQDGRLPRVSVTPGVSGGGDVIWGADFLVESHTVPRADPSRARVFFVVGDAERWCVEAHYIPPSLFSDSSGEWVLAKGERGEVGKVTNGRCGDEYVLALSPVTSIDVPDPGSVIKGASAPVGTCLAYPFSADSAGANVASTGSIYVVGCKAGHFGEIFFAGEAAGDDFGDYEEAAMGSCAAAFEAFVGAPRSISAFNSEPFFVDGAAWETGAREFTCFLYLSADDYPLVGSAGDSRR